jgi:hypothetical protein
MYHNSFYVKLFLGSELAIFSKMGNGGHLGFKIMQSKCKLDARNELSYLKLAGKHVL